jgi:hypothetical protein
MDTPETIPAGPSRDRRSGKRILTLKNFGLALLVSAVAFAMISIASEFRPGRHGDYGRLYSSRKLPTPAPSPSPVVVVKEQEVPDHAVADPTLVNVPNTEEYLGVVRPVPIDTVESTAPAADSTSFAAPPTPVVDTVGRGERIVLTGGPDGVRLDVKKGP